jgi:flagellar FliJ protein
MKRSERIQMVKKVADDFERRRAEALAVCERRVSESEQKLSDLETYREGYVRDFDTRAKSGIGAAVAQNFQAFLVKLEEAMRQQQQVIENARKQRDTEEQKWRSAAQRAEVIGKTIVRWQGEEQHALDRREQRDSDERAARIWAQGVTSRGA